MKWLRRQDTGIKVALGCTVVWAVFVVAGMALLVTSGAAETLLSLVREGPGSFGIDCPPAQPAGTPPVLRGDGTVYWLPVGDTRSLPLEELSDHYRQKYGLEIQSLPPVPLEPQAMDERRGQAIADEILDLMARRYPALARDQRALVIGITTESL